MAWTARGIVKNCLPRLNNLFTRVNVYILHFILARSLFHCETQIYPFDARKQLKESLIELGGEKRIKFQFESEKIDLRLGFVSTRRFRCKWKPIPKFSVSNYSSRECDSRELPEISNLIGSRFAFTFEMILILFWRITTRIRSLMAEAPKMSLVQSVYRSSDRHEMWNWFRGQQREMARWNERQQSREKVLSPGMEFNFLSPIIRLIQFQFRWWFGSFCFT